MKDIEKFYELNQQLTMDDLARKKFTHTQAREKIEQFLANHSPEKNAESIVLVTFCFPRDVGVLFGQNHVVFFQNHEIFLVSKGIAQKERKLANYLYALMKKYFLDIGYAEF
jgi:hypothetical protein